MRKTKAQKLAEKYGLMYWLTQRKGESRSPWWQKYKVVSDFRIGTFGGANDFEIQLWKALVKADKEIKKVLAPGHGFNSERSKQSENGGRP